MARIENLTDHDRHRIAQAREVLVDAERLDLSDDLAMAHMIGRLKVVLAQLLEMVDEAGER